MKLGLGLYRSLLTDDNFKFAKQAGVSFGSALAITISWSQHHSIVWAIIQGFLSWVYVVYYAITR